MYSGNVSCWVVGCVVGCVDMYIVLFCSVRFMDIMCCAGAGFV